MHDEVRREVEKIFFFVLNLCCMKKKLAFKIDNSINLNFLDSESIDIACRPLYSIVYIHTTPRNAGDHYPIIFHTRPTIVSWNLNHFTESMLLNKCKTFWLTDSSPLSALALGITSPLPIFRVSPSCMFSIRWPSLQLCTIIILLKPTGEKKKKTYQNWRLHALQQQTAVLVRKRIEKNSTS